MKRTALTTIQHALTAAFLLTLTATAFSQDSLYFGLGDTELNIEIDFTATEHEELIRVELNIINSDEEGDGRQLRVFSNAPFPIRLESISAGEDGWYELAANPDAEVGPQGLVLARNIFPNPTASCGAVDEPPCKYTLTLEFTLAVLGDGMLARSGEYELKFILSYNETPITIDFTEFFESLEVEAP